MVRRRIGGGVTGLGNPAPAILSGDSTGDKKRDELINQCSKEVYDLFFKGTSLDYDGVDADASDAEVKIGIEPSYQYENIKMIVIRDDKEFSYIQTGVAWGAWGSDIASAIRFYKDYRRSCKFTKLVDKWHPILFGGEHD